MPCYDVVMAPFFLKKKRRMFHISACPFIHLLILFIVGKSCQMRLKIKNEEDRIEM